LKRDLLYCLIRFLNLNTVRILNLNEEPTRFNQYFKYMEIPNPQEIFLVFEIYSIFLLLLSYVLKMVPKAILMTSESACCFNFIINLK